MDDKLKYKYRVLLTRARKINQNMSIIENQMRQIENSLNDQLMINGKIYQKDSLDKILGNTNSSKTSIEQSIIPRIIRKINQE